MDQRPALTEARRALFEAREKRVHPNAERNADFLLHELSQGNGRLLGTWKQGKAKLNGYLEDYAYLIGGLLELNQTAFDAQWFVVA